MAATQHQTNIVIADFTLRISSEYDIELEEGYEPFLAKESAINPDVAIECISGIPEIPFKESELVFEAKNDEQRFYSIYRTGSDLGFIIYDQENLGRIQQIATLDKTFAHWKVYAELTAENRILALEYPLGPIVMHYLTVKSDAVMMHASCAFDGKDARMFTGFSGNGKSTISKLWADAGNRIINDDRIIIRKKATGYSVYNTPMYYKDIPKEAPLSAIYLISHSPENKIKKVSGALAVSKVMAFCIQNNFDEQFIQTRLNFFSGMCSQLPVYELGFVPDQSVVNFVLANEKGGTK